MHPKIVDMQSTTDGLRQPVLPKDNTRKLPMHRPTCSFGWHLAPYHVVFYMYDICKSDLRWGIIAVLNHVFSIVWLDRRDSFPHCTASTLSSTACTLSSPSSNARQDILPNGGLTVRIEGSKGGPLVGFS